MAPTIISEIARGDLNDLETPPKAAITDVKQLSSYNWIEAVTPTVAVPGSPSVWSPPPFPRRLPKDSGLVYIAQNAARHPESPLEPLFRALYISNPSFDIRSTDVVSDRNNIRKLLTFVNPSSSRNGLESFTIKVEVINDTVIFCREETTTQEFIGPHEFRGFGHEFEKSYTRNEIEGSTGHHRIISYQFGGLKFIIRHETDGYVRGTARAQSPDDDVLTRSLRTMSIAPRSTPSALAGPGSMLSVKKEGQVVPLESTIEIKTRVHHRRIPITEAAAQLWVSQTPKIVRAYHKGGMFQDPQVEDVTDDIREWEQDNQAHLRKLAALISKVLVAVKRGVKGGSTAVLKYDENRDKLVVSRVAEAERMLPKDLYAKWD